METIISVIVCVYNVKQFLNDCIESVVRQTYKDIEILLIDDGSTDGSSDICDAWEKKDERIRVFHKENGGVSTARNAGLKEARGEYIFFIDSDDIIKPFFLEKLVKSIFKTNADIVFSCKKDIEENYLYQEADYATLSDRSLNVREISENDFWQIYTTNMLFVTSTGKLYKKTVFEGIEYPEGKINEDAAIICDLIKNKKLAYLEEELYCYRIRSGSIMRSNFGMKNLYLPEVILKEFDYIKYNTKLADTTKYTVYKYEFDIVTNIFAKAFSRYSKTDEIYIRAKEQSKLYDVVAKEIIRLNHKRKNRLKVNCQMMLYIYSKQLFFSLREISINIKSEKR